jgi:hypothetical protein
MVQVLVGFVNSAAPDFQGNPQPPRLCLQAADDGGEGLALTRRHRRSRPGDSLQLGRGTKPRDRRCVSPGPRSWRTGEKARCCCHSTRSEKGGATVVRVTATAHPLISAPGLPARSPAKRLRPNLRTYVKGAGSCNWRWSDRSCARSLARTYVGARCCGAGGHVGVGAAAHSPTGAGWSAARCVGSAPQAFSDWWGLMCSHVGLRSAQTAAALRTWKARWPILRATVSRARPRPQRLTVLS